jgi:hypothetical protein
MKRFGICSLSVGLTALLSISIATAQQAQPVPVEIWACNFVNGSDMGDLQAVTDEFNEWADDNGITSLFSSMMTPIFFSPEDDFDVLFVDAWTDGATLGRGYGEMYSGSFGDVAESFDQVIDCSSHAYFGGLPIVPWSEDRDGGPIQFQDCTVRENLSNADAIEAVREFAGGGDGPGLGGFAVLFPFMGQARDADYSFKLVAIFNDYESMGTAFDYLFRGSGFQQAGATMGDVMDCDTARMYNQVTVRTAQEAE